MLGYVTIGALDSAKSGRFYDAVFGALGARRTFAEGTWIGYAAKGSDSATVMICSPYDKKPATAGNGTMIAFKGASISEVDAAYNAGLSQGGTDEGAPGPRPADSKTFYGAYLRDPTGNKICVYCKP